MNIKEFNEQLEKGNVMFCVDNTGEYLHIMYFKLEHKFMDETITRYDSEQKKCYKVKLFGVMPIYIDDIGIESLFEDCGFEERMGYGYTADEAVNDFIAKNQGFDWKVWEE